MKTVVRIATGTVLLGLAQAAGAYEQPTHEWMSRIAYDRSILTQDPAFLPSIGLEGVSSRLRESSGVFAPIREIIAYGAFHEDEIPRPLHHFFDVQNGGRGLTVGATVGNPSPSWSLEDLQTIDAQTYSLRDARNYFYQGLVSPAQQRPYFMGLTFESLGHVVHHIQDMTQPQHVRNDAHLSIGGIPEPSAYESYSLAQTQAQRLSPDAPGYEGAVDLTIFDNARKFWLGAGAGVAEFTSHNFVSKDTNFEVTADHTFRSNASEPLPAPSPCAGNDLVTFFDIESPALLGPAQPLRGRIGFVGTPIHDAYLPSTDGCNPRTSTLSLFDSDLTFFDSRLKFTLNHFNYDAAHGFLLPRAISYSAGLINYFFRGRLQIDLVTVTTTALIVHVRNVSPAEFTLADSTDPHQREEFEVWYDAVGGVRKQATSLGGADLDGLTLPTSTGTRIIQFMRPDDVDPNSRMPFMLVFRGRVGTEEGVIGQVFTATPLGFLVAPNYLPTDGIAGRRVLYTTGSTWQLSPDTLVGAGNVDWRGWRADDLVTWDGPKSRYWGGGSGSTLYYGGRVLAQSPSGTTVLGASIRYESSVRMLNVGVYWNGSVTVYTRPFQDSYPNNDPYDANTNPLGWRQLISVATQMPMTPLFFNASGTEAQTVLSSNQRLKVSLTSLSAQFINARGLVTSVEAASTVTDVTTRGANTCAPPNQYGGDCHATVNCFGFGTCSAFTFGAGATYVSTFSHTVRPLGNEPAVVCVDYRGDREVLCRYSREKNTVSSSQGKQDYDGNYTGTLPACGQVFSLSGTERVKGDYTSNEYAGDVYRLEAGSLSLIVSGSEGRNTNRQSWQLDAIPKPLIVGSLSYDVDYATTYYDVPIMYLDLRRDIAVYVSNITLRHTVARATMPLSLSTWSGPVNASIPYVMTFTHELIVEVSGRKKVYDTQTEQTGTDPLEVHMSASAGATCESHSTSVLKPPTTSQQNVEPADFFSKRVLQSSKTAVAADGAGNVIMSIPFLVRDSEVQIPTPHGTYNFISHGDLPTLIPGAPSEPSYAPIGVLR